MLEPVHWLGHDAFRIDGPPVVYIDPYELRGEHPPADLILITHDHYDHCSPSDVGRVRRAPTIVVAPPSAATKLPPPVETLSCGAEGIFAGIRVRALPAYNTSKRFHPRDAGGVGYLFTVGGLIYYHAGDTDQVPEMQNLRPDVAFLPVSGTYVMTADEAAEAARAIQPTMVVPMHYGTIVGSDHDARRLAERLEDSEIQVIIKERE